MLNQSMHYMFTCNISPRLKLIMNINNGHKRITGGMEGNKQSNNFEVGNKQELNKHNNYEFTYRGGCG